MLIRLSWVQLERVNPKLSPTHSAQESEWTKAKVVLHCRLSVFERNWFDSRCYNGLVRTIDTCYSEMQGQYRDLHCSRTMAARQWFSLAQKVQFLTISLQIIVFLSYRGCAPATAKPL
ncbi:hypothetical protein H5410_045543 [Solanum commersonii]|uniref:Uncharacterized protein n=1 Tax=Solanum commersonii TaxID=4109 RepID=A0A9J5XBX5_SOLCO|nr:hypothetical protein H5410_045543 [Solanum commersonii]